MRVGFQDGSIIISWQQRSTSVADAPAMLRFGYPGSQGRGLRSSEAVFG